MECVVKRGGEVRVNGEVVKAEDPEDDGDREGETSHRQSWRSCGCWKDLNMMPCRRNLGHKCSHEDHRSWPSARDRFGRSKKRRKKKRQSELKGLVGALLFLVV